MILPPDCTLPSIREIHQSLSERPKDAADITIDASQITSADISFVQLMVSATTTADHQGKSLSVVGASTEVQSLFERTGLSIDPAGKISNR